MVCRKLRNKPGNDGLAICAKTRGGPSARSYKIGPLLCPSKQVNNRKAEMVQMVTQSLVDALQNYDLVVNDCRVPNMSRDLTNKQTMGDRIESLNRHRM
jgi:hypothetical protein